MVQGWKAPLSLTNQCLFYRNEPTSQKESKLKALLMSVPEMTYPKVEHF